MKWQTRDLRQVKGCYYLTDKQLSEIIGRSPNAVRGIRRHLGESKKNQDKWQDYEKGYLKENMHLTDKLIAMGLGRTESEVRNARNRFGLKKK
jgi:hypothetical protein